MPAARKTAPRTTAARRPAAHRTLSVKMAVPDVETVVPKPVAAAAKPAKPVKMKVLRDKFRIPESELAVLDELKERAAKAGHPAKKSDVLRAGVKVLAAMGDLAFMTALGAVPPLKANRPAKA
jgi:hypothetical protein